MEPQFEILNLTDDGTIPNSKYPVIIYGAFERKGTSCTMMTASDSY
ncbi:hypothetical protein [Pedobacter sp. JY14-1]|nr:hypothetical protein [Pedobacter sp. JY14-1]